MKNQMAVLSLSVAMLMTGCGGGGGGSSDATPVQPPVQESPQTPPVTPPQSSDATPIQPPVQESPQTPPQSSEIILNTVNIEDIASELTAAAFGQTVWTPRAMVVHHDILYIGDSYPTPQILRYDLKNRKALSPVELRGLTQPWKDLTDIYILDNRLYVANGVDQRTDIFELQGERASFIMSLGIGTSNVDQNRLGLTYPMGVTANRDYVFVADQQNQISVWTQSDVVASQNRQASKTARLSLPNCMKGCMTRLTLIDQYLYAATNQGQTFVYDIKELSNADHQILIQPIKQQSNAATAFYLSSHDQLMYSAQPSGRIQMFKQDQMLQSSQVIPDLQFDAVSRYRLANQSSLSLGKALDIASHDDVILSLFDQKIVLLPVRRLQHKVSSTPVAPVKLLESQATAFTRVLQDGESWSVLTNANDRHVFMNQILSVSFDRDRMLLKSYSAVPVRDLQIKARLRKTDQWVVLAELDQLTPFSHTTLPFVLNSSTRFNLVDGTGSVRLDGLERFVEMPANLFEELRIDSTTDTHVQKLNQIKAKWKIFFGTYDEPGKWCRITPVYAREWVIMMTNLAYLLSTPEFETLWFNHKAVMGHDFFGNAGKVDAVNGFFKEADYQRVYQELFNRSQIRLGVTNMGGGLGGGDVLGVDTWLFYGHYRLSGMRIIAHEFGHGWGGHSSAWAMEGHGFEAMVDWLNFYFQRRPGSLPYMDPNVNAFHLTPDSELCQGVNQNMVKGVASTAPWNKVDEYFKNNPMPNS